MLHIKIKFAVPEISHLEPPLSILLVVVQSTHTHTSPAKQDLPKNIIDVTPGDELQARMEAHVRMDDVLNVCDLLPCKKTSPPPRLREIENQLTMPLYTPFHVVLIVAVRTSRRRKS